MAALWMCTAGVVVLVSLAVRGFGTDLYVALAQETGDLGAVDLVAEIGLVALAAMLLGVAWRRRGSVAEVAYLLSAGAGVVGAYACSEVIKVLATAPRPCHVLLRLAECPGLGDWSFPSNHTTP